MESLHHYLRKAQQFDEVVLKAQKLSNQICHGNQTSIYKGQGNLFEEVRKYQYGDDVRTINWGITAKLRQTYVKTYNKEKGQTIWLVIDVSKSGIFGTRERTKIDTIKELSVVLALISLKNNCSVGALVFSDKIELIHQPSTSFSSFSKLLYPLLSFSSSRHKTDFAPALDYLISRSSSGALVFIISDFISSDYQEKVKILAQKHDLIGIRVYDRTELAFPKLSYMNLVDTESNQKIFVDTSSQSFKAGYEKWLNCHLDYFYNTFTSLGHQSLDVATDEDYVEKLKKLLKKS
ncbi:uncharacterized protein (DUF58 family) [Pontibacter aydingkolensis]|uniref:DUF58 domain-containing protein n=1 Tax=Pontibacter aydingkolensis TaxID=1911536 RepID=A0ABS7CSM4_9BACT|nr:DUF58 domain-containing protein [Pontibacter aydingkolensis]MBW7466840.1 DUF58 domain-containing protein [Pontibacter aydingkolensis]